MLFPSQEPLVLALTASDKAHEMSDTPTHRSSTAPILVQNWKTHYE